METGSPLPHPSDSSFHDNRSSFLGVCGNLHFNGDVIRIKKLRLEGMRPFLATWNLNHPSPHPSPCPPPPNPPARAAACGPASPLRPSTLKQKNKLQPRPSQRAWSLEAECRRLSREGRVSRHTLSRRRRSEGPAVVFFVVVVIYFIKSFPFLFLLTLMDTS